MRKSMVDRFWEKVTMGETCWIWTRGLAAGGYGEFWDSHRKTMVKTHRKSWELTYGAIAEEQCVLHRCDNRLCVRPRHLFLGDRALNHKDMVSKNRRATFFGRFNGRSILDEKAVAQIREEYKPGITRQVDLAKKYGVTQTTISAALLGKSWGLPRTTHEQEMVG